MIITLKTEIRGVTFSKTLVGRTLKGRVFDSLELMKMADRSIRSLENVALMGVVAVTVGDRFAGEDWADFNALYCVQGAIRYTRSRLIMELYLKLDGLTRKKYKTSMLPIYNLGVFR